MARIITTDEYVPNGWVRIADITSSATDAKILSDAHNSGTLDAVKLVRTTSEFRTGPVWVDPVAAKALLSQCQAKRDANSATHRTQHVDSMRLNADRLCEALNVITEQFRELVNLHMRIAETLRKKFDDGDGE